MAAGLCKLELNRVWKKERKEQIDPENVLLARRVT